ncbi:MAG: hypothetical protein M3Q23_09165 [Actinomycetota bacterium]|nr:hypothetical protein [Actinomycetota bacterium]
MSNQPPGMGRGLFGYRRTSVNQAISDRDILVRQAENRAEAAERRAAATEEQLTAAADRLKAHEAELGRVRGQLESTAEAARGAQAQGEAARTLQAQLQSALQQHAELQAGFQAARQREARFAAELQAGRQREARLAEEVQEGLQREADLRARMEAVPHVEPPPRPDRPDSDTVSEEVSRILKSAEESAAQITERARTAAEQRMAEAEASATQLMERAGALAEQRLATADARLAEAERRMAEAELHWRELRAAMASFSVWKDSLGASLADFHGRVEQMRSEVSEIPDRIRTAFAPLAEAAASAEEGIDAIQREWTPPPIPAPTAWLAPEPGPAADEQLEGPEQTDQPFLEGSE